MNHSLLESLPRPSREAVESAGYRVMRWVAAREVLQTRVVKGRVSGGLGTFLTRWLPENLPPVSAADFALDFDVTADHALLTSGGLELVSSPLEHALLHLPALRSFWSNELRLQHFLALKSLVPQAWLPDDTPVPHGAVIAGLGMAAWSATNGECEMRGRVLIRRAAARPNIRARYTRDDKGRLVLRSVEALS